MTPYAIRQFTPEAISCWETACELISLIHDDGTRWRCHEVARAVALRLGASKAKLVDGRCGSVEHSWLEVEYDAILDVYVPGALPQVQLIDPSPLAPHRRLYRPGYSRGDVQTGLVEKLLATWEPKEA